MLKDNNLEASYSDKEDFLEIISEQKDYCYVAENRESTIGVVFADLNEENSVYLDLEVVDEGYRGKE